MNKRHLHHLYTRLRFLNQWLFLILAIISALMAMFALRNNNLTALKLRDNVLQADQLNGDTEGALRELREHVYGHMNTNLATSTGVYPPIQLKYRYERLVTAEQAKLSGGNQNTVYADAQKHCEATQPQSFYGAGRLTCIQNYIDSHPALNQPKTITIPDSLYKYDFASPAWSPDLAGWSLVAAGFFALLFAIRMVAELWVRYLFKQHM